MKIGDIVFVGKKVVIEGDIDNTNILDRNKAYSVGKLMPNNMVILDGVGNTYHMDRFRIAEIEDDQVQGIKVFKKGDKARLDKRGKFGWESADYTITDGVKEDDILVVSEYRLTPNSEYVAFDKYGGGFHPNHFKLVKE